MIDLSSGNDAIIAHIAGLKCFSGEVRSRPLIGGLCNTNFVVTDDHGEYVVRIGGDIWVHGIIQASVQNAMRAASEIGVTPRLIHAEPGLVVTDFIQGRALVPGDIDDEAILTGWVSRLRELHAGGYAVSGAITHFSGLQAARHYLRFCRQNGCTIAGLDDLGAVIEALETRVGSYVPVFTHNDVVPQNTMVDTSGRVHLIDWDYGGFGHPWFDVAALATNADATPDHEDRIIELYAGDVTGPLRERFDLFKVVVNLREYLWGIVQDLSSSLDAAIVSAGMSALYPDETPGFSGYADMNRRRFEASLDAYRRRHP